jgi:hypothetical protein
MSDGVDTGKRDQFAQPPRPWLRQRYWLAELEYSFNQLGVGLLLISGLARIDFCRRRSLASARAPHKIFAQERKHDFPADGHTDRHAALRWGCMLLGGVLSTRSCLRNGRRAENYREGANET